MTSRPKIHSLHEKLLYTCNVSTLRDICRFQKTKNWYKLKKAEIVSTIVLNHCSLIITRFFKTYVLKKEDGRWCPISLTPIKEITDPYLHDNVVFSRESLISYFKHSVNFINPSTTGDFTEDDILRLGCKEIHRLYLDRLNLRQNLVEGVIMYNFLEEDLEETLHIIVSLRRNTNDPFPYREARIKFHTIWLKLISLDKNRTVCVIKSIINNCIGFYRYSSVKLEYCMFILTKYLSESEI